jgi:hypothetical protein
MKTTCLPMPPAGYRLMEPGECPTRYFQDMVLTDEAWRVTELRGFNTVQQVRDNPAQISPSRNCKPAYYYARKIDHESRIQSH